MVTQYAERTATFWPVYNGIWFHNTSYKYKASSDNLQKIRTITLPILRWNYSLGKIITENVWTVYKFKSLKIFPINFVLL